MSATISNPTPVGRSGKVFLLAQAGDLAAGELNGPACLHSLWTGDYSEPKPLQVWFKWGVYEATSDAEYDAALAEAAGMSQAAQPGESEVV